MFTFEIRINGSLIAHIYGHNQGVPMGDKDSYHFEYYEPEYRKVVHGIVLHGRRDGITKLVSIIIEEVERLKGLKE